MHTALNDTMVDDEEMQWMLAPKLKAVSAHAMQPTGKHRSLQLDPSEKSIIGKMSNLTSL